MRIEPVNRVLDFLKETQVALADDNVDRVFNRHGLRRPLPVLEHVQLDGFSAQVLAKTNMDDVASQYVAEFRGHIDFDSSLFAGPVARVLSRIIGAALDLELPLGEFLNELGFQRLEHVLEPVFVKRVGTCLSLRLPDLVVPRRRE